MAQTSKTQCLQRLIFYKSANSAFVLVGSGDGPTQPQPGHFAGIGYSLQNDKLG
jgi:hypothetical protein